MLDTIAYMAVSASFFGLILTVFSARFRELLKIKNKRVVALACGVVLFISLMFAPRSSPEAPVTIDPTPTTAITITPIPVVFDIPELYGLNIDQIRTRLGSPVDGQPEPTELQLQLFDEWNNMFVVDNYSLLITFKPNDRTVIDFFLSETHFSTCDPLTLKAIGGLSNEPDLGNITTVNSTSDPAKCTGIKILPGI